ncbi:MAG TPA: GerW family sporulation protein [Bacteroidales bacterium]|nr:GerW family sporulation protein [Bacteroidales bacterium]HPE57142.1 GerW family sporulation protein [Bacteroidales bacterium]HRX97707.1 GerW family sporulation protein [Bacteroidales bacterium]
MEFNLEDMLNKVLEQLSTMAKTETVVGEPFKLGDFTCVPVIKVGMGFGSGGGGAEQDTKGGKGGGAGAGIGMEPIGFLVSKGDEISMISVSRSKGVQSIFEKVPDLLDKILEMRKDKDKGKEKKEK